MRLRESGTVSHAGAPDDEEALRWEGDDVLAAPVQRKRAAVVAEQPRADEDTRRRRLGAADLVALGVLGGVALLETIGWVQGVTSQSLASTISPGGGTPVELAAFAINLLGRIAAVLAAPLWFAVVAWRVRTPTQRLAWLVVGALVLLPWPALLHLA